MEELVKTLLTGLICSIVFIAISYFFWKRFDKPTEKMIVNQQSKVKLRHERKMWRAVEDQMTREQATAEEEAIYQRRKADERERAKPPEQGVVSNAWASLGMENIDNTAPTTSSIEEKKTFEDNSSNDSNQPIAEGESDIEEEDDSDVLLIQNPVGVRQDGEAVDEIVEEENIEAPNAPPDWQLVEKLSQLSQSEVNQELPHPEIPHAPELSPISVEVEEKLPTLDNPPEHQQMSEESEVWNSKQELVADSRWAVYWQ
ncbi:MAG: hypothetical protein OSB30_06560 [Candidatus Poseidoniaceae archaeon]|nr:hypothetical protein [Candidatus Poseidoniaceae archaeon]